MSFMMRTAIEAIKGQVFKVILAKLSESDIRQRDAAPVILEKLERYAEPYVKALPKAMNFVIAKTAFALVFFVSFFAFFAEMLRQMDQLGGVMPTAYLIGFVTLFVLSLGGFFLVKAPVIEKTVHATVEPPAERTAYTPSFSASAKSTMEDPALPPDYTNVEQLHRPTPLSGAEFLLNELRAERASFFSSRN